MRIDASKHGFTLHLNLAVEPQCILGISRLPRDGMLEVLIPMAWDLILRQHIMGSNVLRPCRRGIHFVTTLLSTLPRFS